MGELDKVVAKRAMIGSDGTLIINRTLGALERKIVWKAALCLNPRGGKSHSINKMRLYDRTPWMDLPPTMKGILCVDGGLTISRN